jgi:hypothetical protein
MSVLVAQPLLAVRFSLRSVIQALSTIAEPAQPRVAVLRVPDSNEALPSGNGPARAVHLTNATVS